MQPIDAAQKGLMVFKCNIGTEDGCDRQGQLLKMHITGIGFIVNVEFLPNAPVGVTGNVSCHRCPKTLVRRYHRFPGNPI